MARVAPLPSPPSVGADLSSDKERFLRLVPPKKILRRDELRDAGGHAFAKHVIRQGEFPGIKTPEQFKALIEKILMSPTTQTRSLRDGRAAYWDSASGTLVIFNPKDPDLGTAYKPLEGIRAFFEPRL